MMGVEDVSCCKDEDKSLDRGSLIGFWNVISLLSLDLTNFSLFYFNF